MPEQRFATPRPVRLEIKVPAADLDVVTVDGDESTVTVEGSPKLLDNIKVELVGDRLIVAPQRKTFTSFFGRFDDSLQVRAGVPHDSQIEITIAAGEATLDGSFAGVDARSASGDIRVTGEVTGDARAKTVSGSVRLPHVGGDLDAQTVSGSIAAQAVDGSVSAKSVSGDVRVDSVREGRATVKSVSGDIELGVAPGTNVDVDAGSASGQLSSELPLTGAPGGDAGPTLVVRGNTVSGDFRLFRAA
ncbi:MAG TPA: DUF4097 family beta strand repeat-containing protein [Solirubrobacteraceae bacterium]|nr:DUF4097 family beta strand repeat-containing protein [Solirubrobacteraceae bacterium]